MTLFIEIGIYKRGKNQTNSNILVFLSLIAFRLLMCMHLSLMSRLVESLLRVFSQWGLASCWRHWLQRWGYGGHSAGFLWGWHWVCLGLGASGHGLSLCHGGHLDWQWLCHLPCWQAVTMVGTCCCSCCLASLHRCCCKSTLFELVSDIRDYAVSIWVLQVTFSFLHMHCNSSAMCVQHKIANTVKVRSFHLTLFRRSIP